MAIRESDLSQGVEAQPQPLLTEISLNPGEEIRLGLLNRTGPDAEFTALNEVGNYQAFKGQLIGFLAIGPFEIHIVSLNHDQINGEVEDIKGDKIVEYIKKEKGVVQKSPGSPRHPESRLNIVGGLIAIETDSKEPVLPSHEIAIYSDTPIGISGFQLELNQSGDLTINNFENVAFSIYLYPEN